MMNGELKKTVWKHSCPNQGTIPTFTNSYQVKPQKKLIYDNKSDKQDSL
jgi:hypothetical protein